MLQSNFQFFEILFSPSLNVSDYPDTFLLIVLYFGLIIIDVIFLLFLYISSRLKGRGVELNYLPFLKSATLFLTGYNLLMIPIVLNFSTLIPSFSSFVLTVSFILCYLFIGFPIVIFFNEIYLKKNHEIEASAKGRYFHIMFGFGSCIAILFIIETLHGITIFNKFIMFLWVLFACLFYSHYRRTYPSNDINRIIFFVGILIGIDIQVNLQRIEFGQPDFIVGKVIILLFTCLMIFYFYREKLFLEFNINQNQLSLQDFITIEAEHLNLYVFENDLIDFYLPFRIRSLKRFIVLDRITISTNEGVCLASIPIYKMSNRVLIKNFSVSNKNLNIELKLGNILLKRNLILNVISHKVQEFEQLFIFILKYYSKKARFPLISEIYEAGHPVDLTNRFSDFLENIILINPSKMNNETLDLIDFNTTRIFSEANNLNELNLESLIYQSNLSLKESIKAVQFMKFIRDNVKHFPFSNSLLFQQIDALVKQYLFRYNPTSWNIFEFSQKMNLSFKIAYLSSLYVEILNSDENTLRKHLDSQTEHRRPLSKKKEKEIYIYIKDFQEKNLRNPTIRELLFEFQTLSIIILVEYINTLNKQNILQSLTSISTRIFKHVEFHNVIDKLVLQLDEIIEFYCNQSCLTGSSKFKPRFKHSTPKSRIFSSKLTNNEDIAKIISDYISSTVNNKINIPENVEIISSFGYHLPKSYFFDITEGLPIASRKHNSIEKKSELEIRVNDQEDKKDLNRLLKELSSLSQRDAK